MLKKVLLLALFGICSWSDIKQKEISVIVLTVFAGMGLMFYIFDNEMAVLNLISGISIGIIVFVLSIILKGKIGIGDGLILIVTGIFLGGFCNIELLLLGLFVSSIYSSVQFIIHKNINKEIPFVPFLFISYVILEIL